MKRILIRAGIGFAVYAAVMATVGLVLRLLIPSEGDEQSDEIALAAVFDGIEMKSQAGAFRGGSARAIMGGLQLDLTGAKLDPAGADLDVRAIMGGIQIIVPKDWRFVVVSSHPRLGGVDWPKGAEQPEGLGPALRLTLSATFAGVEITNPPASAEPAREPAGSMA